MYTNISMKRQLPVQIVGTARSISASVGQLPTLGTDGFADKLSRHIIISFADFHEFLAELHLTSFESRLIACFSNGRGVSYAKLAALNQHDFPHVGIFGARDQRQLCRKLPRFLERMKKKWAKERGARSAPRTRPATPETTTTLDDVESRLFDLTQTSKVAMPPQVFLMPGNSSSQSDDQPHFLSYNSAENSAVSSALPRLNRADKKTKKRAAASCQPGSEWCEVIGANKVDKKNRKTDVMTSTWFYDLKFSGDYGSQLNHVHEKFISSSGSTKGTDLIGEKVEVVGAVHKARMNKAACRNWNRIKTFQSEAKDELRRRKATDLRNTHGFEDCINQDNSQEVEGRDDVANQLAARAAAHLKEANSADAAPCHTHTDELRHNRIHAQSYGTAAQLKFSIEMRALRISRRILEKFRNIVNCEKASIMFYNRWESKISLFIENGQLMEFSSEKGIAGHVIRKGLTLNVEDAYSLPFFNRDIDKKTGFRTRSVLCQPIYSAKSVCIIGVIQMLNKIEGAGHGVFSLKDENSVQACGTHISRALEDVLEALVTAQAGLARSAQNKLKFTRRTLGSMSDADPTKKSRSPGFNMGPSKVAATSTSLDNQASLSGSFVETTLSRSISHCQE